MTCVCPGSFDPVHNGHVDVVRRAAALWPDVVVAVVHNPAKAGTFSPDERADLVRAALVEQGVAARVAVVSGGLLVDYCREVGARSVVKGVRSGTDYAYELPMALMNRQLADVETVFVPGDPAWAHVSSSLLKEVARHGGDVAGMVPAGVAEALRSRFATA